MSSASQFALLTQRRFGPFFWTQFLGAFNDNVFKTALLTVLTYEALSWTAMDVRLLNNLIPGLFILPFVLFSATSGQLADKFEKSRLTRYIKLMEIAITLTAAVGWMTHNLWLLVAAVAGMGLQSTLFGPVKYAYLPQHLKPQELVGGNGVVEMGTFVGILLGEIIGAMLVLQRPWGVQLVAAGTIAIAVIGWLASRRIPLTPAAEPELAINWNPASETARNLRFSRQNRPVFLALLGNSWFWFYGAIMLAQFPVYAKDYLHGDHGVFVLLLTAFSLGIGGGSLWCDRLSGHKTELGLVVFGSIGLSLFGFDLFLASAAYANTSMVDVSGFVAQTGSLRILFDCVMIGVFGGVYVVPLFVLIQTRCDPSHLSRTIAGMNVLNALFMVAAALIAMALLKFGASIPQIFLATAILNVVAGLYLFLAMPEFLVRFFAWLMARLVYRMRTANVDRIPAAGAALLICDPVANGAALAIQATCSRPVRLVLDQAVPMSPILSWLHAKARTIRIVAPGQTPSCKDACEEIDRALAEGELVCIFASPGAVASGQIDQILAAVSRSVPVIRIAVLDLDHDLAIQDMDGQDGRPERISQRKFWQPLSLQICVPVIVGEGAP